MTKKEAVEKINAKMEAMGNDDKYGEHNAETRDIIVSDLLDFLTDEIGMIPPSESTASHLLRWYPQYFEDDGYHGIVCKFSQHEYLNKLPQDLIKMVRVVSQGRYSVVMPIKRNTGKWEEKI